MKQNEWERNFFSPFKSSIQMKSRNAKLIKKLFQSWFNLELEQDALAVSNLNELPKLGWAFLVLMTISINWNEGMRQCSRWFDEWKRVSYLLVAIHR